MDRLGGAAASAHGKNDGSGAGDDVTAGEDSGTGGALSFRIGLDITTLVCA